MNISVLKSEDYHTASWSGGASTELYIWPEGSTYQARDFLLRLSTASVDREESEFTHLPGVKRILMPLTREITVVHEGEKPRNLKPWRQDIFMGDHRTWSRGRTRDFNVMTRSGCEAALSLIELEPGIRKKIYVAPEEKTHCLEFFFALSGEAKLGCGAVRATLLPGMLLAAQGAGGAFTVAPDGGETARLLRVSARAKAEG